MKLNVLIACEESQAECKAFRDLGHNAYSCDIKPCRKKGNPSWHIQADVTPYLDGLTTFKTMDGKEHHLSTWHLIIAHPPCTYLSKVGARWLYKDTNWCIDPYNGKFVNFDRWEAMKKARSFFMHCLQAKANYLAVENPIPMELAQLPRPTTYACPSWFGVKYTKKTLYWLRNLPPLMPTVEHPFPKCYTDSSRGHYRSRTFPLMAEAIAKQWSEYIIQDMKSKRVLGGSTAK